MEALTAMSAEVDIPTDEQTEANRSLPAGIREALQRLLDEYARMEEQRQQASLNEARLHARIAQLEKQLKVDEKARALLAKRVAMLEFALREERQRQHKEGSANATVDTGDRGVDTASEQKNIQVSMKPKPSSDMRSPDHLSPQDDDGRFASADNKYKTLPSNFLASSRNAKVMSPGRRMLWKYLEELGYMPNPKEDAATAATTATASAAPPAIHVQPQTASAASASRHVAAESTSPVAAKEKSSPPVPSTSAAAAAAVAHDSSTMIEDPKAPQIRPEKKKKPGRDSMKLRTKPSGGAGAYSFTWTASTEDALDTDITWKPKMTLVHHLDAVRAVCFHDSEMALISGSEDGTVKLWNISADRGTKRGQPVHTFHGHKDMITALSMRSKDGICASSSADGRVFVWSIPDLDSDPYDDLGSSTKYLRSRFTTHTDAVWDVHISPTAPIVFSAGADARVHVWKLDTDDQQPLRSLLHDSDDIPVSIRSMGSDASKVLTAYTSGDVVQFDVETGKEILVLNSPDKARLTCIRSHPQFPLAFASGADNSISYFDINAGSCVHRMLAHAHAVTSLSISPDGSAMMSSCHDSSIRFWDVAKRICVQDLSAHQTHRRKYSEGIHSVAYHPSLPCVASGGTDCAIRVYQS